MSPRRNLYGYIFALRVRYVWSDIQYSLEDPVADPLTSTIYVLSFISDSDSIQDPQNLKHGGLQPPLSLSPLHPNRLLGGSFLPL